MTILWLAFALLLLPALWLLVRPLRLASGVRDTQQSYEANDVTTQQNVSIYRRRLASLQAARDRGDVDSVRFEEDRLELERNLLDDTQDTARRPLKHAGSGRIAVPVVMLLMVAASVVWYQQRGSEGDLSLYATQQKVSNHPDGSNAMMIEALEREAVAQPGNPNVWSSLVPLYRETGQASEAIQALERLIELEGRHPSLLAQLAQTQYFAADRTMSDETQALVDEVLQADPRNPSVLGMLGIQAFDEARYEEAIEHWRRAIAGHDNPDAAASLREGIAEAQRRLGVSEPRVDAGMAGTAGIRIRVSLDEALADRVETGDTVYVIARDPEGEGPPLAVARARADELPLTLTLDDGHAMSEQAQLSDVSEARLMVRVSSSGQATPQQGDLFGEHEAVPVGRDETVDIVIDRVFD
ncbi:c-type cytochrome biogenesis protein CcmI [Aidingimonas lacisalsi]|uniref:c-type cytochrome biogenesis protein CcmI n=1 Tax=Aidingimonas lacisalsi TaxID=2604086 RepID=UPI0011D2127F|nr:c-type cytochrome biogenesis protein CcmI [Aidingimonas lacisalsi]